LADSPEFRAEYELLQKEVPAIKELIPMVKTPETSDEKMPVYGKTALLTEIEEIFGKQEQSTPAAGAEPSPIVIWKWALGMAAVVALILIAIPNQETIDPIAKTPTPVTQLAMLDIVGETRGEGNEIIKTFKEAWPKAAYENYSEIDPAKAWRGQWADDTKAPQVKIFYDVTEAEIIVLGKWKGETKTETLLVDDNLAEMLQKAQDLVKEWYGDGSE
jgi:hypothetical protein